MIISRKNYRKEISRSFTDGFKFGYERGNNEPNIVAIPADISIVDLKIPKQEAKDVVRCGDLVLVAPYPIQNWAEVHIELVTRMDSVGVYSKWTDSSWKFNEILKIFRFDGTNYKCIYTKEN